MFGLRQACGWALGILLRRHMPVEEALEAFNEKAGVFRFAQIEL